MLHFFCTRPIALLCFCLLFLIFCAIYIITGRYTVDGRLHFLNIQFWTSYCFFLVCCSFNNNSFILDVSNRESFKSTRKMSLASNETSGEREPSIERVFPVDARRVSAESRVEDVSGVTISDQEEVYLTKNMPWLKVISLFLVV